MQGDTEPSQLVSTNETGCRAYLIEGLCHVFAGGVKLLAARMPSPGKSRLLELGSGVLVGRMLHFDSVPDRRSLQVADDLYADDRHEFAFEWQQDGSAGG